MLVDVLNITSWLTKQQFSELSKSNRPQVVLFATNWCGYCSRFLRIATVQESPPELEMKLVDADDPDESLWDDFEIKLVPTLVIFESGQQLFRRDAVPGIGLRPQDLTDALKFLSGKP